MELHRMSEHLMPLARFVSKTPGLSRITAELLADIHCIFIYSPLATCVISIEFIASIVSTCCSPVQHSVQPRQVIQAQEPDYDIRIDIEIGRSRKLNVLLSSRIAVVCRAFAVSWVRR